ncbi:APC family permease [Acetobacter estunensis]|uniref:APC family permease n=1 Tax=Acetobacter estunensis TaxID=104097 RepID=UPI001C2D4D6F|nr:amino acid permease [Acetobacter estunensis]MBV1836426.1 amino acid permease [Acetobacter estunensis]
MTLRRTLGPIQLTMLGVGSTIGAGIYVMTGTAAANYAGPAIVLSFMLAGLACLFTAFSYGELAAAMPVSGSAYGYARLSFGRAGAWWVGWLLLLEYGISCSGVAAGFSGYATSLLADFGVMVPGWLHTTMLQTVTSASTMHVTFAPRLDLIGAACVLLVTFLLMLGVQESARINTAIVLLKVGVLFVFVAVGIPAIHPALWHPFIPPYEGGFRYGVPGIFRAASVIFFAYVGFEVVSTASPEARNPKRDVPIGIIVSLILSTVVYLCVALVLMGVVPWRTLDVADPLALAVDAIGWPSLALLVKLGAVIGLCSVVFGLLYGQSRIFFTMARDRLLPAFFCTLHPRYRTPTHGTLVLGTIVALATALLPIDIISDLVSLGTATAFAAVNLTAIIDRNRRPDAPRPFRMPSASVRIKGMTIGIIPTLGIFFSMVMVFPLVSDMLLGLFTGNPISAILLLVYLGCGAGIFRFFGSRHA